ncbi:hypothetical protein Tco_0117188 [Tanacetum coccineum]
MFNSQEFFFPQGIIATYRNEVVDVILLYFAYIRNLMIGLKTLSRTQIAKLQRKQLGNNSKIALARFKIANLEHSSRYPECLPKGHQHLKHNQTQAASGKLVVIVFPPALDSTATTMANADNTNRNTRERKAPVARKCSYKEFMSCQPINFKGTEGAVGLICWFEQTESVFSHSNCTEDCKVKFATSTLTE